MRLYKRCEGFISNQTFHELQAFQNIALGPAFLTTVDKMSKFRTPKDVSSISSSKRQLKTVQWKQD
jgi:hypothetical protein